ncbi:MAG TPA: bifunctional phosphopantothenoylcysteine decarboxylase/phosphopantothenate--cysteine ligase CoaBC [Bacillota bacterium]
MSEIWRGRCILLGVAGGIAAYKAAMLASRLVQLGADVHVVMTPAATAFIGPLTFSALTGNPVHHDVLATGRLGRVDHVELAHRAELCLVAPATADLIGKLAAGLADDALTTVLIGTRAPLLLAPGMEQQMYEHPAVQDNLARLKARGVTVVEPEEGYLASGRTGRGRMADVDVILAEAERLLIRRASLRGRRLLVSAGPTREYFDPVRFLSNPSTGKMGFAIAEAAARRGAQVVLVAGPVSLPTPPGVRRRDVVSAADMRDAVLEEFATGVDAVIMAAAVADYAPAQQHEHKRKKTQEDWVLHLVPTTDILAELGRAKRAEVLVGFAAESENELEHARRKLLGKNLDLIVLNNIKEAGAGFAVDTNRVRLLWRSGRSEALPLLSKAEVAERILDAVVELLEQRGEREGG